MSTNEWAARAAKDIKTDECLRNRWSTSGVLFDEECRRIASIIATHAAPLAALLRESRREHQWEEEEKCDFLNSLNPEEKICTCGADAWNARLDAVLAGQEGPKTGQNQQKP